MIQYPNEKDPHSDWTYPGQQQVTPAAPPYPPSTQNPPYAPTAPAGSYAAPSQYHVPSAQEYLPPQGPPPAYAQTQGHPDARLGYDQKGPSGNPMHEAVVAPPPSGSPYGSSYRDPAPNAGSSSSSSQDGGNGGMSLGAFFGNKGPPSMWQRQPPGQLPYNPFPPMCLISNKNDLGGGFPELPPPCQQNPHPFATHDVTEEDWKRFLSDVKKAGSLSPVQRIKSGVLPSLMGMGLIGGFFMSNVLEKKMKYKNRTAAGDLVDHWNHYFFGPRKMEVVLCQASERLSGKLGAAPVGDPNQERMAHGLRRGSDESSSSSSSEDDSDHRHGRNYNRNNDQQRDWRADRDARRAARRERRCEKRAARRAKRTERRERKARGDDQRPYQLFITATN